ncbi:MAG: hypothetical protein V3S24_13385, partial [Candidatus Tectomicrobia bacterium]
MRYDKAEISAERERIDVANNGFSPELRAQGLIDHISGKGTILTAITEKDFRHGYLPLFGLTACSRPFQGPYSLAWQRKIRAI